MAPPVPERIVMKLNPVQKEVNGMTVKELREYLEEAYNGDADMLLRIRRTQKGSFSSPDSLVSMFYDHRNESSTF
jgi:hypothetical protein